MLNKILPAYKDIHKAFYSFAQQYFAGDEMLAADAGGEFNKALWQKAAEMNLHGLPVDKESGGRGYSAMETCAAFEGFAKGCLDNGLTFAVAAHAAAVT